MRQPLRVLVIFFLLFSSTLTNAMWAGISDSQLINESNLIVKATYIGATTIGIDQNKYHLGVLNIEDILKGDKQAVVFIHLPVRPKGFPQRSDEINFKKRQKGIWFLEKDLQHEGIYEINHPQRFIPETQYKNRLPALFKLLD